MRNIQSFWPGRLTNAAHGQYVTGIIAHLKQVVTENELFKNRLASLEVAFKAEDEAYVISTKSEHTLRLREADLQQDSGINGLRALITAAQYNPALSTDGVKVDDAIRPYRLDTKEQVAQEAYKVAQCVAALEAEGVKQAVTAIGGDTFVKQMKEGSAAVTAALQARNEERAQLTPEALANARVATDAALKEAIYVLDAMITLFADTELVATAAKIDELTRYTKQHMQTQPAAPAPDAGAPAPTPTPGDPADPAPDTQGGNGSGVVTPVKPAP